MINEFSDVPTKTECLEHKIILSHSTAVGRKPFPILFISEQIVRGEIFNMIELTL